MKIGIDCGALSVEDTRLKVGVYWITKNIIKYLSYIDKVNTYYLYTFLDPTDLQNELKLPDNFIFRKVLPKIGWTKIGLKFELFKNPIDIFIGLSQFVPNGQKYKKIGYIYDLGFISNPSLYHGNSEKLSKQTKSLISNSDQIITISNAVKNEIINYYQMPELKIKVNYLGVEDYFFNTEKIINNEKKYFLYVGALKRPKNIINLLKAFKLINNKFKNKYDLLMIGSDFWPTPEINTFIQKNKLTNNIKFIGQIDQNALKKYYSNAICFVSPSYVEGFCMPAIEAMASRCPVVLSDIPVFHEITENNGLFSNPDDFQKLAQNMIKTLDINFRKNLTIKALNIAKKYKWSNTAKHLLEIVNSL